jgi:signal transduction histidine kinase
MSGVGKYEVVSPDFDQGETPADSHDRWRGAWILLAIALAFLGALQVFGWWVENGGAVDIEAVLAAEPGVHTIIEYFGPDFVGYSLGFGAWLVVAALALSRDRSNRFGWVLGLSVSTWMLSSAFAGLALLSAAEVLPSSWLPILAWFGDATVLAFPLGNLVAFALFPNGRLMVGETWGRVFIALVSFVGLVTALTRFHPDGVTLFGSSEPLSFENPFGLGFLVWLDPSFSTLGVGLAGVALVVTLVRKYVGAGTELRHQMKWLVFTAPVLAVFSTLMSLIEAPFTEFSAVVSLWLVALALGVAITKHRLYEIDLIINRAVVFGALAAFIGVVYVAVVVGVGRALGGPNLAWSIAATALVAVVFEPIRDRVQRWANRLVYGSRATPYEVLSDLTGRLAAAETEDRLLTRMAERLGQATGAVTSSVWLTDDVGFRLAAASPDASSLPERVRTIEEVPGSAFEIEHDGEVLGALTIDKSRGDVLTPTESHLIEDLAGSAGLVMRRLRLDDELERKAVELEESRRRLLDAQDVERQKLERELHDGPQQRVVGLKVKLGVAQQLAERKGIGQLAALTGQMATEAQDAIEQIRSLAQGIYPPLLQSDGLKNAIPAMATTSSIDVNVDVRLDRRLPMPTEAAVYFCISEALTNAAKHGEGPISVSVSDAGGALVFEVADCGPGFDPAAVERGAGLNNMSDRLDVLGGSVEIASQPGASTRVTGSVPIGVPADA